jgi:type III pantothenate kinase
MLLVVDIGNTNTKLGVFDESRLISKFSIPTSLDSTKKLENALADLGDVTAAIVCSVVPDAEKRFAQMYRDRFDGEPILVRSDFDFGLKVDYQPPESLGCDRLVNAFSAVEKYGAPCIVCSLGTATTIDVVSKDREFLGGSISPGMGTMARALNLLTAHLPKIELEKPDSLIGNTTVGSMQSGIFYGQIALIEGMITRFRNQLGYDAKVIATGGFSATIAAETSYIDFVDANLTLDGLRILFERWRG